MALLPPATRLLLPLLLPLLGACGGNAGDGVGGGDAAERPTADASGGCTDDGSEDDDDVATARVPDYEDDMREEYTGSRLCPGDEDWFYVFVFPGETAQVSLTFDQADATGDLDVVFYAGDCPLGEGLLECTRGELLTPCTDRDPSGCDADNGQSRDSDETFSFTATAETAGDHWFVVRGFQGGQNDYDLCTAISPETCL